MMGRSSVSRFFRTAAEAYRIWEREQRAAMKADMIDEIGEAGIEEARAADRLPPWWDEV